MSRFLSFSVIVFASLMAGVPVSGPANAHPGHMGELAGHGHWLGWGLVIGAGLAAAAIARLGKKDGEEEKSGEVDAEDGETDGSAA